MNGSVLAWNVRGLCASDKRARVKAIIKRCRASVVGLVETKWCSCSQFLISSVSGSRSSGWVTKNAVDSRGDIVIFWDKMDFSSIDYWEGDFSLAIRLHSTRLTIIQAVVIVYRPHEKEEKFAFLRELEFICRRYDEPLCILGDFNLVRSNEDYRGGPRCRELMMEFNNFINHNRLVDLPLQGALFTRSSGGSNASLSRIDRALVNLKFEEFYSPGPVQAFERAESDHSLILLQWGMFDNVHRPWRFENMWLLEEGFLQSLIGWWSILVRGSGLLFCAGNRLRQTKQIIKIWNSEVFVRAHLKIEGLLEKIKELDDAEERDQLSELAINERSLLKCELDKILLMEEISW
ncbi:unnamed protein product [Linum trigynum]|uniref:Endonuclease/exonuclease/phosphatase domain-containing protein n=1 Tax=Linum trigynum TaxID=586398 RepID=A0AAV2FRA7_9ROSI